MKDTSQKKPAEPVVLITGGSGFLGAALVRELLKEKSESVLSAKEIRIFDIKPPVNINNKRIKFINSDIRSQEKLEHACEGVDLLYHCASVIDWGQLPKSFLHDVNVNGTLNVIEASKKTRVKALVFTSTMDVLYAGRPIIKGDESVPYPEKYSMAYAETKAIAEQAVLSVHSRRHTDRGKGYSSLRTCSIRPCGMFGEGDPYHVSSFLRMAKSGRLLFRIGSGKALFQHVYVGNVAHAHVLAGKSLLNPRGIADGKTYFITDFDAKNFFDYMEPIITGIGYAMPPESRSIPAPIMYAVAGLLEGASKICRPFIRFSPKINRTSVAMVCKELTFTSIKAAEELGYRPLYSEEEAIARTIEYFRTHGPV